MSNFEKVKLLFFGILLPAIVVYGAYLLILEKYDFELFNSGSGLFFDFSKRVISGDLDDVIGKPQLIIVGDSTARTAYNPARSRAAPAINMAQNWATAMTTYFEVKRYLDGHPVPACVLFLHNYSWRHGYSHYFSTMVPLSGMSLADVKDVWQFGAENDIWPATEMNIFRYYFTAFRNRARLGELRLAEVQQAMEPKLFPTVDQEKAKNKLKENLGFQGNRVNTILPDDRFFSESLFSIYQQTFEPSAAEDFYLVKLAELAEERGFRLLYGAPPVAASEFGESTKQFLIARRQHARSILGRSPAVRILANPLMAPRGDFTDFTHLNQLGARNFTQLIQRKIQYECGYAQERDISD
jgi:hypothetical protein